MENNPINMQQNSPAQQGITSFNKEPKQQPEVPAMSDSRPSIGNENLLQGAGADGETTPEYGDAADPTFEKLSGGHDRDE